MIARRWVGFLQDRQRGRRTGVVVRGRRVISRRHSAGGQRRVSWWLALALRRGVSGISIKQERGWATNSRNVATRRRVSTSTTREWSCETPAMPPSSRRAPRLPTVPELRATRIPRQKIGEAKVVSLALCWPLAAPSSPGLPYRGSESNAEPLTPAHLYFAAVFLFYYFYLQDTLACLHAGRSAEITQCSAHSAALLPVPLLAVAAVACRMLIEYELSSGV